MVKQLELAFMEDLRREESKEAVKRIFIPGYMIKTFPKDWDSARDKTLGFIGATFGELGKITMYAFLGYEVLKNL